MESILEAPLLVIAFGYCLLLLLTTTYAWLAGRHSFVESTVRMDGGMGVIQPQEDYGELCNFTQGWTALAPS